jgi:hypothetical protein
VPVQSGGSARLDPRTDDAKIEAGGTVCIPLLTGDMDISAYGTVTAVAGDRVLAFGHPMFAEGPVNLPMATGVVHTFIPSLYSAFKMASNGRVVGAVRRDENFAILGVLGEDQQPYMTPITVKVKHWDGGQPRTYRYEMVDEWYFTPAMATTAAISSATADHGMPLDLTIRFGGVIRFKGFQPYVFQGSGDGFWGLFDMAYFIGAPIDAMINNPWGKALVESVYVEIELINEVKAAYLRRARLEQSHLRPGEEVSLHLTLERYRQSELEKTLTVKLPDYLPDGEYTLRLMDAMEYGWVMQMHNPRQFSPENMTELLAAFQKIARPQQDRFYVGLTLKDGGIQTKDNKLPDLPASRLLMMRQAGREELYSFTRDKVWPQPMDIPVYGYETFTIRVDKDKGRNL